ncbi:OsmC family protein [Shewanella sp. Isolate11]|uniref:OsmC family protein n=1 Tax=Shewanella sp. Isolate11 TaxID=2908530 RepID=UPI001EFC9C70|nr:OsmC family protein [Shewanella sp. Isolate11]MCG9697245.1 OsmC family protein [Shewanella sp. Isolate11]
MAFSLTLTWTGQFTGNNSKDHLIEFGSGQTLEGSAAADYLGADDRVNPEESLLAALSSCHMLSFLTIANKMRLNVVSYHDSCTAILGCNEQGRTAITQITLAPQITFERPEQLTEQRLAKMHALAHKNCFIANSLSKDILITLNHIPFDS